MWIWTTPVERRFLVFDVPKALNLTGSLIKRILVISYLLNDRRDGGTRALKAK